MAVTSKKSRACMLYTIASLSFQLNSAEEVRSKPGMFSFRDTNRRSHSAYMCAYTCAAQHRCSPKNLFPQLRALSAEGSALPQPSQNHRITER